jgi:ribosome maturation factor RimP
MTPDEIIERVQGIVKPILEHEGMELVDIEYRREANGWVLRIYIDKEGGVTIGDCSIVSQAIDRVLDIEDFISNPYHLEVSSPGLNRPLKSEKDFKRYRNRVIKLKTFKPIEKRRNFKGRLIDFYEDQIEIEVDGEIFRIPFKDVAKANLEIDF